VLLLGECTWVDVKKYLEQSDLVLLPVGSTEQHGPHLPLDTDTYDAVWICKRVAEVLKEEGIGVMICPPLYFGVSLHHMDFPGTVSLMPETLSAVVFDICSSLYRHGFRKFVIVNGHGGNRPALNAAAQNLKAAYPDILVVIETFGLVSDVISEILETKEWDIHAGEIETSTSLYNREDLVRKDRVVREVPEEMPSKYMKLGFRVREPKVDSFSFSTKELSKSGVIGDATKASKEKGKILLEASVERLADLIRDLVKR